jgi:hypothetical protein
MRVRRPLYNLEYARSWSRYPGEIADRRTSEVCGSVGLWREQVAGLPSQSREVTLPTCTVGPSSTPPFRKMGEIRAQQSPEEPVEVN